MIVFLICLTLIILTIFYWSNRINKIDNIIKTVKLRNDIILNTTCRIIFKSEESSIDEKMNVYFFEFGILISTFKKPLVLEDNLLIYLYNDSNMKKIFKPTKMKGRLSRISLDENILNFRSFLTYFDFGFANWTEWDCTIIINDIELIDKLKTLKYLNNASS